MLLDITAEYRLVLSVIYTECRKPAPYAEWRYAECRYAECQNAECRGAHLMNLQHCGKNNLHNMIWKYRARES